MFEVIDKMSETETRLPTCNEDRILSEEIAQKNSSTQFITGNASSNISLPPHSHYDSLDIQTSSDTTIHNISESNQSNTNDSSNHSNIMAVDANKERNSVQSKDNFDGGHDTSAIIGRDSRKNTEMKSSKNINASESKRK